LIRSKKIGICEVYQGEEVQRTLHEAVVPVEADDVELVEDEEAEEEDDEDEEVVLVVEVEVEDVDAEKLMSGIFKTLLERRASSAKKTRE